jgi:hypothetical protein
MKFRGAKNFHAQEGSSNATKFHAWNFPVEAKGAKRKTARFCSCAAVKAEVSKVAVAWPKNLDNSADPVAKLPWQKKPAPKKPAGAVIYRCPPR